MKQTIKNKCSIGSRCALTCSGRRDGCPAAVCWSAGGRRSDASDADASEWDSRRSDRGVLGLLEECLPPWSTPWSAGEFLAELFIGCPELGTPAMDPIGN